MALLPVGGLLGFQPFQQERQERFGFRIQFQQNLGRRGAHVRDLILE